jgi:hypothetical protein
MGHFRKAIGFTGLITLLALPLATPAAASNFDGEWNVYIASNSSACGNGASVSIGISDGHVTGGGVMSASGHVGDGGNINVALSSGLKHAVGYGRLSGTSGSGTWRGSMCSGTWTASRI